MIKPASPPALHGAPAVSSHSAVAVTPGSLAAGWRGCSQEVRPGYPYRRPAPTVPPSSGSAPALASRRTWTRCRASPVVDVAAAHRGDGDRRIFETLQHLDDFRLQIC